MVKTNRSIQKSGQRTKQGQTGKRSYYITRQRALRKLQLSLKDFRRLCILKGIFPREAPKTKDKGKIYYHTKDISFLSHERLIQKYRDLKVYLRKRTRYYGRHEEELVKGLDKPVFKLDHLVRERYPTMADALRDLDDPLSMLSLFASLPVKLHASFTEKDVAMVARLLKEFSHFVITTQSLRKVFVSIKGYYFQALINNQTITWLVPHSSMQTTPKTVDYEVMTTFLQFYQTMLRCVNFKLYKEISAPYPPVVQTEEENTQSFYDSKMSEKAIALGQQQTQLKSLNKSDKQSTIISQTKLNAAIKANVGEAASSSIHTHKKDDEDEYEGNTNEFQQLDPSIPLLDEITEKVQKLFKNQVFLVGRECSFEQISFVIRSGGGIAISESSLDSDKISPLSPYITHQVMDRPLAKSFKQIVNRIYIQPQWIFDSFNMYTMLPSEPYAPGQVLPPHLSPFVDDEKEGYVPDQRNQLRDWVGLPPLKQSVLQKIQYSEEQKKLASEKMSDISYQKELLQEHQKITAAAKKTKQAEAEAKKINDTAMSDNNNDMNEWLQFAGGDDDDIDENIIGSDVEEGYDNNDDEMSDDNNNNDDNDQYEDEEDAEIDREEMAIVNKPKPAKQPSQYNAFDNDKQLSKIVMNKKDKRLHNRMMFGIVEKQKQGEMLQMKKDQADLTKQNPVEDVKLPKLGSKLRRKR